MDILEIKDLEKLAKKRVPKMFFDYVNSGSWTETTYNENVSDYSKIKLRQRVAVDMTNRKLNTKLVDQDFSMPVAIAPTGLTGMQRANGEILAAQACEEFGTPWIKKFKKNLVNYYLGDIGALNQIIHIWKFKDDNERRKLWKQIFSDEDFIIFASKFRPLVLNQENKIMTQAPWVEI